MRTHGLDPDDASSFLLIEQQQAFTQSSAALSLVRYLRWPWQVLRFLVIVPRPCRDWVYRLVATYRYQWFGQLDQCRLPAEFSSNHDTDIAKRFIETL